MRHKQHGEESQQAAYSRGPFAACPGRAARERLGSRDVDGLTLIETIIAIALLVIVLLPTTLFVIESQRSLSQSHLQAEANTLASQALAGLQAEAARDDLPNGFQTTTQAVDEVGGRKTLFTISTTWTTIVQGTNETICAAGSGGAPQEQLWLVTASVTWNGMNGAKPVTQTTEISPGGAGGIQRAAGELAVSLDYSGTTAFTAASVTATVTGTWDKAVGAQPAVPSGEYTSETGTSASSASGVFNGCIVFQDLDVTPGWTYVLSLAGNPTITQAAEFSDSNPNGPFSEPVTLQAGVPEVVTVELGLGTPVSIDYTQGPGGSCTTAPTGSLSAPATTSEIPITVNNSGLTTYTANDWVAYNATGTSFSSLLLYPGFTTVTSIWAGAGPTSSQAAPCTVNAAPDPAHPQGPGDPQTVYLQLYDLDLSVTGAPTTLTATQVGGSATVYDLNVPTGPSTTSATDIPLGQYIIGDGGGTVTSGGGPAEIWVTEGGNCVSSASTPPASCNTTPNIPVTAS